MPPLLTIAVRCGGGAALLYLWVFWRGGLERPTRAQWLTSAAAGAFLFVGCHGVLALGRAAGLVRAGRALHDLNSALAGAADVGAGA